MKIRYTKRFSRDLDEIQHQVQVKKRLLSIIEKMKAIEEITELGDVKKIEGYTDYYRVRLGDYRLGLKLAENSIEMIRFLHRKDIYRRFP
jgi:mRNA interferase RelE/StbE